MKNVTITVSGETASGKTIVAAAILEYLTRLGFTNFGQEENIDSDLGYKLSGIRNPGRPYAAVIPTINFVVKESQSIKPGVWSIEEKA